MVRFPLNEASWLGYTVIGEDGKERDPDPGHNYRATVIETIKEANENGLRVILDLHWSAPGKFCPLGQNPVPDADHSVDFWKSVAETFKDNPSVMFELFNEPYLYDEKQGNGSLPAGTDLWKLWLEGGKLSQVYTPKKKAYEWTTAGMQQLVDAIRATGAKNVILSGGNGYSNDLTGWPSHMPQDPLRQLAAVWHAYGDNQYVKPDEGKTKAMLDAVLAAGVPLIITEVAIKIRRGRWARRSRSGSRTGLTRAGFPVWAGRGTRGKGQDNVLIKDANGTPSDGFGVTFRQHLQTMAKQETEGTP